MPLKPAQLKQLHAVLTKINGAIEGGYTAAPLKKLSELNAKFPRQPMILSLIGKANQKMGRHAESIDGFARAVDAEPKDSDLRFQHALALQKGGRYDESLVEYERALYYTPNHFLALRHKCSVLTDLDRIEEAHKAYDALCRSVEGQDIGEDRHLAIAISGARLSPKAIEPKPSIERIKKYIDNTACDSGLRVPGYWQMGRLYDHLKEYDLAFAAYKACKEIKKEGWEPDQHAQRIDKLIDCWTGNPDIPFSKIDGSRMIFIVGMMRSGTSLTEQMLAQIDNLTPGGEMNAIARQISPIEKLSMPHGRPYATTRMLYTQSQITKMANAAQQMYNEVAPTGYLTDKQPYNYAHVPLIAHMFPGCKFIHCTRDPLDCCLSNYTQAFSRPHMQTHDLYWLGRFYRDYERLMKAWHTIEEVEMIDLSYEKLVAHPEEESRRVIGFLGLEWSEDILNFHQSKRTVSTASRDQVRRPMYTSSVQKYKRYESHLDELKRGLGIEIDH